MKMKGGRHSIRSVSRRIAGRAAAVLTAAGLAALPGLLPVLLGGCASDDCEGLRNSMPFAGFYRMEQSTDSFVAPKPQQITIDSLRITGLGAPGDSILSDGKSAIGQCYLPFRIDSDTTVYVFSYLQKQLADLGLTDTVRFVYTREPRFVSSACGVSYLFSIKEISTTHTFIDSVVCPMMMIDNADRENLRIYFRTSSDDEP